MKRFWFYLVATPLILWLIWLVVPRHHSGPGKIGTMWMNADKLAFSIELYKSRFGEYPEGDNATIIKKLTSENPRHQNLISDIPDSILKHGEIVDAWRKPLEIEIDGTNSFTIKSGGPNQKFGDGDDIVLHSATNHLLKP